MTKTLLAILITLPLCLWATQLPALRPTSTQVVASCIYLEARGEGYNGMEAVACVIQNRMAQGHLTAFEVVTKQMQFSCFNSGIVIKYNAVAYRLAAMAEGQRLTDTTNGATFYYNPSICAPSWACRMRLAAAIGHHRFMKD